MKKIIFLVAFVISLNTIQSQTVKFNRMYRYSNYHGDGTMFHQGIQKGNNYITFGQYDTIGHYMQPFCAKFDSTGNILLWKAFRDTLKSYTLSYFNTNIQTSDGGYIISGTVRVPPNTYHGFLMKLDSNLNMQWRRYYYDTDPASLWTYPDYAFLSLNLTPDNGYLATGIRYKNSGKSTALAIKFDSLGNQQWIKTHLENINISRYLSVISLSSGEYVLGGGVDLINNPVNDDVVVIKTDSLGNIIWQKTFGGIMGDGQLSLQNHPDGSIMVFYAKSDSAVISTGNYDGFYKLQFHKLSPATGDTIWNLSYGPYRMNQCTFVFRVFSDGSALASGTYGFANTDSWLLHLNREGTVDWYKEYKTSNTIMMNMFFDLQKTNDSGYIVTGRMVNSDSANSTCGWLLKVDAQGRWQDSANYIMPNVKLESSLEIYPNPASSEVTVTYFSDIEQGLLEIYNTMGTKLMEVKLPKGQNSYKFSVAHLAKGYYKVILKEKGYLRGQVSLLIAD